MARPIDPTIETRIMESAGRLLSKHGQPGVTMRAVAAESGIAVTTIYEKFASHEHLLEALALFNLPRQAALMGEPADAAEMFVRFMQIAQQIPNEAKLGMESMLSRLERGEDMPLFKRFKSLLIKQLGGEPDRFDEIALGLSALGAGCVLTITSHRPKSKQTVAQMQAAALSVLDLVLQSAATTVKKPKNVAKRKLSVSKT